jgi:hypothetical protein
VAPLTPQLFYRDSGSRRSTKLPSHLRQIFVNSDQIFVIPDTARFLATRTLSSIPKGVVMTNEKEDVATLIELLKMADERRAHLNEISPNEPFNEDFTLLQMWAEACRRTGVGTRAFPPKVLELWKASLGRAH